MISSFYNEDELVGAKDVLLKVIGQVLRDGDVDVASRRKQVEANGGRCFEDMDYC